MLQFYPECILFNLALNLDAILANYDSSSQIDQVIIIIIFFFD